MLLSLAMGPTDHSVKTSTEILNEVISLVKPANLPAMVATNDFTDVKAAITQCTLLREEVQSYCSSVPVSDRLREVLERMGKFIGLAGQTSQRLVDLNLQPGDFMNRVDALGWFGVISKVAEEGVVSDLEKHLEYLEGLSTKMLIRVDEDPLTPPPGFAEDPRYLEILEKRKKDDEAQSEKQIKSGLFLVSQLDTLKALHAVHVAVNRD